MSDLQIIRIDDAKALVRVGVPDPERATPQEVRISVTLALADPPNFTKPDRVAGHCLSLSDRALWVEVTVKKPSVLSGDGLVAVTIRRERSQ